MAAVRALLAFALLAATPAAGQNTDPSPLSRAFLRAEAAVPALPALPALPGSRGFPADPGEPGRETRRGAIIGGIAGAVAGLGIGVFIALYCEIESTEGCVGVVPGLTLLGAAGGAVAGAIIGAAIPRDDSPTERVPGDVAAEPGDRRAGDGRIGSAVVQVAESRARMDPGIPGVRRNTRGLATHVAVFAELKPWLAVGPALGQAWLGEQGVIRYLAVAGRGTWPGGRIEPYLVADLGVYQWTGESREFLGGGVGLGARWTARQDGRLFLDAAARWQQNVQVIEHVGMASLGIGLGVSW